MRSSTVESGSHYTHYRNKKIYKPISWTSIQVGEWVSAVSYVEKEDETMRSYTRTIDEFKEKFTKVDNANENE